MRRFIATCAIFVIIVAVFACSPRRFIAEKIVVTQKDSVNFDYENFEIILSDSQKYPIYQLHDALTTLLAADQNKRNILIHVHGAGDYPRWAFWRNELEKMRDMYDSHTMMFNWPSWKGIRTIPRANAVASGDFFMQSLKEFADYVSFNTSQFDTLGITLHLHSMATEVFRSGLNNYQGNLPDGLFDTIVMVAPEVELADHAEWIENINFADKIFIFMNSSDKVLEVVKIHTKEARLGMQVNHLDGEPERLANNAYYIIADGGVKDHKYYIIEHSDAFYELYRRIVLSADNALTLPNLRQIRDNLYEVTE